MERLTAISILGGWTIKVPRQEAVDRLAAYEDTGLEPSQIRNLAAVAHVRSSNPIEERLELAAYRALGTVEELAANMEMFAAYRHVCGGRPPEEITALVKARDEAEAAQQEEGQDG